MRLEALFEGLSPILYHITTLPRAAKIVSDNRFILEPVFKNGSEEDISGERLFFMSTARLLSNDFFNRFLYSGVIFVLDGEKLRNRYTGRPVSYYSHSMRRQGNDEMEDRILSNDPIIPNALDYIKEIHVFESDIIDNGDVSWLRAIKASNKPVFFYDDRSAFRLLDKRRSIPLSDFIDKWNGRSHAKSMRNEYDDFATKKAIDRNKNKFGERPKPDYGIRMWLELMLRPVSDYRKLPYQYRDTIDELVRSRPDYNHYDLITSLENSMIRMSPENKRKLASIMRKNDLRTRKDILDYVAKRWEPMLSESSVTSGAIASVAAHLKVDTLDEVLRKVDGRWAVVSKTNPKKVLQYYRGPKGKKPSEAWVRKVERRVKFFKHKKH